MISFKQAKQYLQAKGLALTPGEDVSRPEMDIFYAQVQYHTGQPMELVRDMMAVPSICPVAEHYVLDTIAQAFVEQVEELLEAQDEAAAPVEKTFVDAQAEAEVNEEVHEEVVEEIPAVEEPVVETPAVEEPVVEEVVETPVVEEAAAEDAEVDTPVVDEAVADEPKAEEDAPVVEEAAAEEQADEGAKEE